MGEGREIETETDRYEIERERHTDRQIVKDIFPPIDVQCVSSGASVSEELLVQLFVYHIVAGCYGQRSLFYEPSRMVESQYSDRSYSVIPSDSR